ncbi:MAG: hypothetical protein NT085_02405 [candidate division SR1 bacterium]|nr:hypothetical protein [candidate division SR1 bacterium]
MKLTKNEELHHKNKEAQNVATHAFTNVGDIIDFTNDNLGETIYIGARDTVEKKSFIPEKKDIGRMYWTDFTLKTKKEAQKLIDKKSIVLSPKYKNYDFYVYNERTNEIVPFKKNDFMMFDHGDGYLTFDGTSYIYYDDNGYEKSRSTYVNDPEPNIRDLPEFKRKKT